MSSKRILTDAGYMALGGLVVGGCIAAAHFWCWIAQTVMGWIG